MNPIRISCEAVRVNSIWIPPFQLRAGEVICLHMPGPALSKEEELLIQALIGSRPVPGLQILGRVAWANCLPRYRGSSGWLRRLIGRAAVRRLQEPRAVKWLEQASGVGRGEALALLENLSIPADSRLNRLPANSKVLLALAAAWACHPDVVLFSTVGCDPAGKQAIYREVSSRLAQCAALYLAYPFWQDGQRRQDSFPGATCIKLRRQENAPAPLSTAEGQG